MNSKELILKKFPNIKEKEYREKGESVKKRIVLFVAILILIFVIIYLTNVKQKYNVFNAIGIGNKESIGEKAETKEDCKLGTLQIEKIGLDAPIMEGSSSSILKDYVGHIEETSIYDGNVGLAAHNRGNEYSYFSRLNELEDGDIVLYKTPYGTRTYKVNKIEVISETDWTLLAGSKQNKLTMITCISNRPTQRLCVQAVEI